MGFFSRLRDDARFTAGAWRALRHTMPIARHPTRIFPTLMEEAAARHGDKPALISDAETLTYLQAQKEKRQQLQGRITQLQKERDAYAARAQPAKDGFDEQVLALLRKQATVFDIKY